LLLAPAPAAAQERIELEGPVTKVDGTKIELYGGLVVFETQGAEIETDDDSFRNVSDLKVGTDIEVDANVRADGVIVATKIEVSDEKNPGTEIGGVIGKVDEAAGTFTIGPVTIHRDGSTKLKKLTAIQSGLFVEVTLDVSGASLRATMVEREEADD
jgi:hypothetical protein